MSHKRYSNGQLQKFAAIDKNLYTNVGSFTRQSRPAFPVVVNNECEHNSRTLHTLKNHRRQYCHRNSHNRRPFR